VTRERGLRLALVAAGLFMVLDQVTKQLVVHNVARSDELNVFFGIDLVNVRNTGVAFGALSGGGLLIKALVIVAVGALLVFFFMRAATPWLWLPVGVIVGGALGNLADRARIGAVIDFIDPVLWPAFNVADVGVVVGIFGLFYVTEVGGRGSRVAGGGSAAADG
jgi:signal peptidase II